MVIAPFACDHCRATVPGPSFGRRVTEALCQPCWWSRWEWDFSDLEDDGDYFDQYDEEPRQILCEDGDAWVLGERMESVA